MIMVEGRGESMSEGVAADPENSPDMLKRTRN